MAIGLLISKFFRKDEHHKMSRRKRVQNFLENLSPSNNSFELRCWHTFSPKIYQRTYSLKEAIEEIYTSPWDGEGVFSTSALNPIHKKSTVAYFPIKNQEVLKVIKAGKDAFHIGRYVFRA